MLEQMVEVAPTRTRAAWPHRWLPPVLAYLAGHVVLWLSAHRYGYDWFDPLSKARWDTGHYISVGRDGYLLRACDGFTAVDDNPLSWCGNTGWFPLYGFTMRPLVALGMGWVEAGVLVSEVSLLGALVLLWHLLGARTTVRTGLLLALAAVFPGSVYFHAVFPMALSVVLALATFALLARERWLLAGLAGLATAMTYPMAVAIAPAALVYIIATRRRGSRTWLAHAALVCGLSTLGTLLVFTLMGLRTGRFDAYPRIQDKYGAATHNPVVSYVQIAFGKQGIPQGADTSSGLVRALHATVAGELHLAFLLLVAAVVAAVLAARRRELTGLDLALLTHGSFLFVVPLVTGAHIAQFRSHALMLPLVILLRHLPRAVLAAFVVAAVPVAYFLGALFLTKLVI